MSENRDLFENSSVPAAVLKLALPSVAGQIVLVIYNMADTFFVGLTKSDPMLAAVTVSMPAFMFLSAISNFFGIGAAGVMSRSMGKGDDARAKNASRFAFWGCLLATAAYSAFVFFAAGFYADILGGRAPDVHGYTAQYLKIAVAAGGIPTALCTMLSHIIRSEGRSFHASAGLIIGGVLNIALDPLFMFVLFPAGNEVKGAAAATALSNLITLLYYGAVVVMLRGKGRTCISYKPRRAMLERSLVRDIAKTGLPACIMTLFENISYAVLENLVAAADVAAQAGLGVAKKINMLAHSTVRGMSQGVLSLIAYNYASGNRKRMKKAVYTTAAISVSFCLVCTAVFLTFGRYICGIFIKSDGESLMYAQRFLSVLCIGAPFSAFAYTVISFFQATGKGMRSFWLAILRKGLLDIPLMFILNALFDVTGAVAATPVTDAICCLVASVMFFSWIKKHGRNKKPSLP